MERYITDTVYTHTVTEKAAEAQLREKQLYARLSALISGEEYLQIEEELNRCYSELEKELFCKGFNEGIRFLLLGPGEIDHSESSRNNQSKLIRNSQCTLPD